MDLERIKKRNELFDRGAKLIEQARRLDLEGNYIDALPTYTEAIETLFQTLQYVSNGQDKTQLRTLIEQFLSRAEEIKAIFAQQQELFQYYSQHSAGPVQDTAINSAVQQLEAIHLPTHARTPIGRQARTSTGPSNGPLPGTSQSMTPVTSPQHVERPTPQVTSPSTNPWASGASSYTQSHAPHQSPQSYATQPYSPHNNAPYSPHNTAPYSPHNTQGYTPQSYPSPQSYTAPYSPHNYTAAQYSPGHPAPVTVDQYGNVYSPGHYPSNGYNYPSPHTEQSVLPQRYSGHYDASGYYTSPRTYNDGSYNALAHTQSYYESTAPPSPYGSHRASYSQPSNTVTYSQPTNPWGNYAQSSCDPCITTYQCAQGLPPVSNNNYMTPVNMSQSQYSPVTQPSVQYTTSFTDLNSFITNNNLTAAVPQPDRDREKIILYFVSKGFQRQHVESSYDYLRKMNLQVNADFVEILKDALLVYPTSATTGSASPSPTPAQPSSGVPNLSEVNTLPRPQWVADDKAPQCRICGAPFTVLFRRHHCRGCGHVVCALCSDKEVPLPKLGYIHPVRVCKTCYENRALVELKTTSDSSTVKVAAATFTKSVSDSLSKGTDFIYTQFLTAVARNTSLDPTELADLARTTGLSESEISAQHLAFQEHRAPSGEYELHNYRYVLGPLGYSQPLSGPDVVEWLYATLHHSFYMGTSTAAPKGVTFKDYIATMGTLLRGTTEAQTRLGFTTLYIADQLGQTPLDPNRASATSYVLDKRKYPKRETARLPQAVTLQEMKLSVDHVTALLFGVVEWLRCLKINMDRRHDRIDAAVALLQQHAQITWSIYHQSALAQRLVTALLYGHTVFPGHPNFSVMFSLMFAMQLAVDSAEANRPIVASDFSEKRSDQSPHWPAADPRAAMEGVDSVAAVSFCNVKLFTPTVWRAIRNKFGISETDLIGAIGLEGFIWPWLIAGEWRGWTQQGSYGKSGSIFFHSCDGQYLLKTIGANEAESLREMLAKYHDHVTSGPTLLTPFLGLVQLKDNKGKETYFLAMRTVFTTAQPIEACYDLKGSVAGRITAEKDRKPGAPMKDLDFDRVVELHPTLHTRLLATLERDAKFLAAQGVMDYSLLLGITHQQPAARDVQLSDGGWPAASGREVYYLGVIDYLVKFSTLKLLESTFKSFKYARHEISALPPGEYCERFIAFMQNIFKAR